MNGRRIHMEDRVLVRYPVDVPPMQSTDGEDATTVAASSMGIFGVFDGHGDGGYASEFVASNLVSALEGHPDWPAAYYGARSAGSGAALLAGVWTDACERLDEGLRNDRGRPCDGGTTGIMAVVTDAALFVGNVGDSRCILGVRRL